MIDVKLSEYNKPVNSTSLAVTADYVHMYFSRTMSKAARRQKPHSYFKNESGIVKFFSFAFPNFDDNEKSPQIFKITYFLLKPLGTMYVKRRLPGK